MLGNSSWLPTALTSMAHSVDSLFYIMLGVVTFFFVLVEVLLITFLIRYRRTKRNQVGVDVHGNNLLETVWTLIPAAILVFMGAYSVRYVYELQTPPANPVVIDVIGHEWFWEFKYPNGVDVKNDLRVPAGQNVLFNIHSADVIHGFYIPEVRIQQDALNDRITQFWMNANPADVGKTFDVPCDQFCGTGHPIMVAKMTVMSADDFNQWLQTQLQQQQQPAKS
ncbi:MAG: cytochrome c oxidase subunit II [Alicyclobacillus sp.]|nr:cytochrome c oxidase subunit II [Alicyclobacillus sp.]